ncbi:MAG: hypothetical protein FWG07_00035 [Treponema sp.]|nr:hypothetical protein [Treponema sp.]
MDITEIQDELLRLEFPNLLPDHDPDIERYYYLRSTGQSRDALSIYQNRLVIRYPDNEFRTWLLRCYRSHDPAFRSLLAKGYRMLGARSLERIKQILLIIAEKADAYNEKDVYSTIKTAEEILKFLSPERYEAVAGMERFLRYSVVLELKVKSIAKATELVRAYLTDTLSVVEEERRRRMNAKRHADEENRKRLAQADWDSYYYQKKYGIHMPFMDLSTVVFSQEDLARIEIPPFSRVEDQILGYCIKYWNNVEDPAFERILFLYSRKYGKKNYDVYMTIRRGQMAKRRDDEILSSIMSILVTGYYYSIQGDLYLQRNWNGIKHALTNQGQHKALPAPKSTSQTPAKAVSLNAAAEKKPVRKKNVPPKKLPVPVKPEPKQIPAKPVSSASPGHFKAVRPSGYSAGPEVQRFTAGYSAPEVKKPEVKSKKTGIKKTKPGIVSKTIKQEPVKKEQVVSRIAPKPKSRAAPKIAPKATTVKKPVAVVARPAVKSTQLTQRRTSLAKVKPVKVPYKLKPAEQTKTTIMSKPAVQPKPAPAPVQKTPVQPRPAPIPVPKTQIQPKPAVQPKPAPAPVQKTPIQPRPTPVPVQKMPIQPKPIAAPIPKTPIQPVVGKPATITTVAKPTIPGPVIQPKAVTPKPPVSPVKVTGYQSTPFTPVSPSKPKPAAPRVFSNKTLGKAKGSVSDRLKELSGRSYDVYEDRFLTKARSSIRKVLGTGKGLFFSLPEEAEDLVYNFLRDHYSDPYMDWETSNDRKNLMTMGFDLPSINPVIDECYRNL